ncbi:MAG: DUF3343 domain-containing protein [Syntrophomonadaceae bacterium]
MVDIVRLEDYCIFTFVSTSHALKAEKLMKEIKAAFEIIPTPREVSTSCGVSIKVRPDDFSSYYSLLTENRIKIEGAFRLSKKEDRMSVCSLIN